MPGRFGAERPPFQPELTKKRIEAILSSDDTAKKPMNFSGKGSNLEVKQNLPEGSNVFGTSGVESIISQQKINADGSSTNTRTTNLQGGGSQKIINSTPAGAVGNQNIGVQNNSGFSEFIETPIMRGEPFDYTIEDNRLKDTAAFANNNQARADYGKALSNYFKEPSMANIANLERRNTMKALEAYEADEPIRRQKAIGEAMDKGFELPLFSRSIGLENILGVNPTRGEMEQKVADYNADEPIRRQKAIGEAIDKGFELPLNRSVFYENLLGIKPTRGEMEQIMAPDFSKSTAAYTEADRELVENKRKFSFDDYVSPGNPNDQTMLMNREEIFKDSMADQANSFIQNNLSNVMNREEILEDSMADDESIISKNLGDVIPPKFNMGEQYELAAFGETEIDGVKTNTQNIDLNKATIEVIESNYETEAGISKPKIKEGSVGAAVNAVTKDKEVLSALEVLQEKVDSYRKSPELIAAELEQFLTEAGYLKDVSEDLYKGAVMFATSIAMGSNLGQAMSASFGQLALEDEAELERNQANKDRMFDLLKTNGKYMTPASWNSALKSMNLTPQDEEYFRMLRESIQNEATETASVEFLEKVQEFDDALIEMIHVKTGDNANTADMFEVKSMQQEVLKKLTESGRREQYFTNTTQGALAEAYTEWNKYKDMPADKEGSWWQFWKWFGEGDKMILDPIVFYDGMQGLIGADGISSDIVIDPDNEHYEHALIGKQYLKVMHGNNATKMAEEQADIYNQWFKEEFQKSGSKFKNREDYLFYFATEVKERLKAGI